VLNMGTSLWLATNSHRASRGSSVELGAASGPGGVLYMQKIEELEAENARLEDLARNGAALYVPKIQELEDEVLESQRELEMALEGQRALQQDLAEKAAVVRDLLRRCGLTDKQNRVQRMLSGFRGQTSPPEKSGGIALPDVLSDVPALRVGELERALERALVELAQLQQGPPSLAARQ